MRRSFHHRLINSAFEDPCLYVRLSWQKRAFLIDSGDIRRLSSGDIMKISDVFVSHTHVDHFLGFDTIIRNLLRRDMPLSVYGPREIIDRIEGKLRGYSWNLIKDYPLRIEVFGVDEKSIYHSSFSAENRFERQDKGSRPFHGSVIAPEYFTVKAAVLDHDIPCVAFSLEEDMHINIDKALLTDMGLPVGPWLSDIKQAIRENTPDDQEFKVSGKSYSLGELRPITTITEGQKVSYVTDASPSKENVEKIIELVRRSDTLYCEAYFLDADRERALERHHLTARMAGEIARLAEVKKLVVMHFSPRYRNAEYTPEEEALAEFGKRS